MPPSQYDHPSRNTRSKGLTSRGNNSLAPSPPETAASTQSPVAEDVGDLVTINWSFLATGLKLHDIHDLELKQSQMRKKLNHIRDVFYNAIVNQYDEEAPLKASKLYFWVPKEKTSFSEALTAQWGANHLYDFDEQLEPAPSAGIFEESIPRAFLDDDKCLHLIITDGLPGKRKPPTVQEIDTLGALPPQERFEDALAAKGPPPSTGSRSKQYSKIQSTPNWRIYDGRCVQNNDPTMAAPLEIFHPIFEEFRARCHSAKPTREDLIEVQEFMAIASLIYTSESDYASKSREALAKILRGPITLASNTDTSASDGVYAFDVGIYRLVILFMEFKREWGEGGSDTSTQAGLSMKRLWSDDDMPGVKYVRPRCSCPTLILVGGGPWLGVLGGVFTDKVIVQRLTDMMWIAQSSTYEDSRAYRFAQTMVALRESLLVLKEYYTKLIEDNVPEFRMDVPHPRFYPYPTSCDVDGLTLRWKYVEALDSYSTCVTFLAEVDSDNHPSLRKGSKVVIKFVDRYGEEAHRFLAKDGHAPNLWYYGPVTSSVPSTSALVSPSPLPGIALGRLQMVVMDQVSEADPPEPSIPMRLQLIEILTKLHQEGYVFGDLRRPNVFLDKKGLVKLIDFDWAGPYDRSLLETLEKNDPSDLIPCDIPVITTNSGNTSFATYPMDLSKEAFGKTGAEDLKAIRPVHDWRMLRMMRLQDGS